MTDRVIDLVALALAALCFGGGVAFLYSLGTRPRVPVGRSWSRRAKIFGRRVTVTAVRTDDSAPGGGTRLRFSLRAHRLVVDPLDVALAALEAICHAWQVEYGEIPRLPRSLVVYVMGADDFAELAREHKVPTHRPVVVMTGALIGQGAHMICVGTGQTAKQFVSSIVEGALHVVSEVDRGRFDAGRTELVLWGRIRGVVVADVESEVGLAQPVAMGSAS